MKQFLHLSLLALTLISKCYASEMLEKPTKFDLSQSQFELGCTIGRFISVDKDYAETGLFVPVQVSQNWVSFFDGNAYRFIDGNWAASNGLGIRQRLSDSSLIGVNAYYDYRRGEAQHNFHRVGLGFEWLNTCFDVRLNGYLPVGNKTQTSSFCNFNQIGGGFFATRRKIEYAYRGFDAEFGVPLWNYCDLYVYAAGGPYYYFRHRIQHLWGGFGRLIFSWNSIVSLQIRTSYDRVYSSRVQGCLQLSIPLDFFCSTTCNKFNDCSWFWTQPVRRNNIIQKDHCCNWTWNWDDKL